MTTRELVAVRFIERTLVGQTVYHPKTVAGFLPDLAKALIDRGSAIPYTAEDDEATAARPARRRRQRYPTTEMRAGDA